MITTYINDAFVRSNLRGILGLLWFVAYLDKLCVVGIGFVFQIYGALDSYKDDNKYLEGQLRWTIRSNSCMILGD